MQPWVATGVYAPHAHEAGYGRMPKQLLVLFCGNVPAATPRLWRMSCWQQIC